jgi:hypothetical protein
MERYAPLVAESAGPAMVRFFAVIVVFGALTGLVMGLMDGARHDRRTGE